MMNPTQRESFGGIKVQRWRLSGGDGGIRRQLSGGDEKISGNKILVIFCGPFEINKAKAKSILLSILNQESLHRIILVLEKKINSFARTLFEECQVKVEMFLITELFANITKHVAAPKIEILGTKEKEQLLKKYELAYKQLPYMLESDAIARYYGLEKKQVVKITYNSKTTGLLVTYRCVI
nr:DNA-directed RNA polymerase V subunit 5C [Tanacetum cinerariifolium]